MNSLVSIHDVMPETLTRVDTLIGHLAGQGHTAITLLVVPGRDWQPAQVDTLQRWQDAGMELAAHGWHHRARHVRGLRHRLHATLISRNAAEHLALTGPEIIRLMQTSAQWFTARGLTAPTTYVPPAWALGPVRTRDLRALPYDRIETTRGLLHTRTGERHPLPLVGFEADTRFRAGFLRHWNRWQTRLARHRQQPLRVGIHPHDPELLLASELDHCLTTQPPSIRYDALASRP